MKINKHDTQGTKPLLGKGELGYDDYVAGGDVGRVYVGTGSKNIALAEKSEIDSHIYRTDNPHSVTKAQVGLGNVDNTADVNKNVATAALASKLGEVRYFPTDNNQDFNSCTDGGVYSIRWGSYIGTLNTPPTVQGYGTLFVEAGALFMTQTFTAVNDTITYKRTKYVGTDWSAWTKVISEDANGNVGIGTSSGHLLVGTAVDDGYSKLQVAGIVKSTAGMIRTREPITNNIDLNTFIEAGIYTGNNLTNRPSSLTSDDWLYIEVISHDALNWCMQRITTMGTASASNRTFQRCLADETWTPWREY